MFLSVGKGLRTVYAGTPVVTPDFRVGGDFAFRENPFCVRGPSTERHAPYLVFAKLSNQFALLELRVAGEPQFFRPGTQLFHGSLLIVFGFSTSPTDL